MIRQIQIVLPQYNRGFHLITSIILPQLLPLPKEGLLNIFIQHTSAALTINENADSSVRSDLNTFFNRLVKECDPLYTHIYEGDDDMPAHIKSSLIGNNLSIPIQNGKLAVGTCQGSYLCEFRNEGGKRKLLATIMS